MQKILIAAVCGLAIACVLLLTMLVVIRNAFVAYQEKVEQNPPKIVSEEDVGYTTVIHGSLDRPIGEEMTIHGRTGGSMFTNFLVDSIDEKQTPHDIQIHLVGATRLPEGTEATIRGRELARIQLHYPGDWNSSPSDLANVRQYVLCVFKPSEVLEPKGLPLEEEKGW